MFEGFTAPARQMVVFAQDEARSLEHNYIGSEHLLLGLLRAEEGVAADVLKDLGITLERVRGDERELFLRHHQRLLRVIAARVSAPLATVEDACAFAWLQLVRHQPERGERLFGWLAKVAYHEALAPDPRRTGGGAR